MKRFSLIVALMLGMFLFATSAQATVLRVVVVETSDPKAYMGEIEKLRAHNTRLGSKTILRVWRARFAGEQAGDIVVSVEYADLATMVADMAKSDADAEFSATLKGMDGIRKIVSDSLYDEQ